MAWEDKDLFPRVRTQRNADWYSVAMRRYIISKCVFEYEISVAWLHYSNYTESNGEQSFSFEDRFASCVFFRDRISSFFQAEGNFKYCIMSCILIFFLYFLELRLALWHFFDIYHFWVLFFFSQSNRNRFRDAFDVSVSCVLVSNM